VFDPPFHDGGGLAQFLLPFQALKQGYDAETED
jgi:hypothetical protein